MKFRESVSFYVNILCLEFGRKPVHSAKCCVANCNVSLFSGVVELVVWIGRCKSPSIIFEHVLMSFHRLWAYSTNNSPMNSGTSELFWMVCHHLVEFPVAELLIYFLILNLFATINEWRLKFFLNELIHGCT